MENNKLKEAMEEKTMFDEMRESGSNIPDKVKYLQEHGWQSYKHHDNWVRKDLKDWEKDLCNFDLNSAYEECLRKENELPNAIEVLCNALREDTSEGSLYQDWCYKAAIAFKAEWEKVENNTNIKNASDYKAIISHQAAKNFLNLLISK